MLTIIDRYIIRKFLGTLGFMLALLSIIVLVIDVSQKQPRIKDNGLQVSQFLIHYYPFWIIYLIVTFLSVLIFISVIYFTSRIANNTEIVAVISSGASFHRFARPYFITALFIALVSLAVSNFILPWSNIQKNKLEPYTYTTNNREKILGNSAVSAQITPNEYIFIESYNKKDKLGTGFSYERYNTQKKLLYKVVASNIYWDDKKKSFKLNDFFEKTINKDDSEILKSGTERNISFGHGPEELFPNELLGQNKTTPELLSFIEREKQKGNSNINSYYNELYLRFSMPFSIVILTILALSLSSQKKRGGLGINLAMGITLAFVFVFSFEALKVVSQNKILPPLLAMWLPNIIFGPITFYLYMRRAYQ